MERWVNKIILGDCLEIMKTIPGNSIDAIITDPPFAFTGGISNGSSANVSGQFFSFWWREFCNQVSRILKPTASGFIWCDWKTAKIISDGFEPQEQTYDYFRIAQMLYHYREMPGQGQPFRSSVDMIAYLRGPKHKEHTIPATQHNFISSYWYYGKHEYHPAEKSPTIVKMLMEWCSKENDIVFDPFTGSGVVGVVAREINRRFIGVEIEEKYQTIASKRIDHAIPQERLFL